MVIPKLEDINNAAKLQERYIEIHYNEFHDYLVEHYTWCRSFSEMLYAYYNSIESIPICPVCRKQLEYRRFGKGYAKYCSKECVNKDKDALLRRGQTLKEHFNGTFGEYMKNKVHAKYGVDNVYQLDSVKEKIKNTTKEHYGVEHCMQLEGEPQRRDCKKIETCKAKYGVESYTQTQECKDKIKNTCLERYGADSYLKTNEFKDSVKNTCLEKYGKESFSQTQEFLEKSKRTCLEKYGVEHHFKDKHIVEKAKQTTLKHYGTTCYTKSDDYKARHDEIQEKINHTKHELGTFNSSNIEQLLIAYLDEHNISYRHEYRSELYPFNCDFYFPGKDLYVEINAMWTHGSHPYDCTSEEDQGTVQLWKSKNTKFYENAIDTWTIRDVQKRECAKRNGLNYLEIFSNDINDALEQLLPRLQ